MLEVLEYKSDDKLPDLNIENIVSVSYRISQQIPETDREPEDADSDLPAQNGEENPRTLPQRQDFQHQTQADDKHQRHGTPRGTPEMEMGRPRVETPRLQMGAYFHHVGPTHREAKPRKTWDQMGGLLQEPSWTPVVQNSQELRRMEIATVCQYRVRVQVYTQNDEQNLYRTESTVMRISSPHDL
ncbi:hypothetical protein ANN_08304 [Periplaneta americana]|uniref:Uncharacterized protein n=1 Tax=Periplaneta americana TaxID=6978 RepID=A0ABQ8T269_PERAM|nr:hypothetical protein ANN_08304 [Periplaneta americana]